MEYYHASKRKPVWRGVSKFAAKSVKINARKQRKNYKPGLIISIDMYSWRF